MKKELIEKIFIAVFLIIIASAVFIATIGFASQLALSRIPKEEIEIINASEQIKVQDNIIALTDYSLVADEIVLKKIEDEKKAKAVIKTNNNTIIYTQGGTDWWNYPEEILTADVSGDPFYIVVNKKYRLPSDYIPTDLGTIPYDKVRTIGTNQLKQQAIDALVDLVAEARKDGIDLSVASAYRSYQKQSEVYNYYLKKYKYNYDYIDKFSARPGHSEHQLATTVDFSTSSIGDRVGDAFNSTDAAKWLINNANRFGFYMSYPEGSELINGYKYESWHYRYYTDGKR